MIKVKCIKNNETFDISDLVINLTWSGDVNTCSRKLTFSVLRTFDIPLSSLIILYYQDTEIFRGFVFERNNDNPSMSVSYIVFDYGEKLNKIKVSKNIKSKNAKKIASEILSDNGFKIGDLAESTVTTSKIFLNVSVYEVIMTAYTNQSKVDGKSYMLIAKEDTINVIEKGKETLKLSFEEKANLISSSFSENINNLVNKVVIVDESGNKIGEQNDDDLIKTHGIFQEIYKKTSDDDESTQNAIDLLSGVESSMSIKGYGDTTCITGYGVKVKDTTLGLVGLFFIDSDTHNFEGGKYTIDLGLNMINIMNEVQAGEDEQSDE